MIDIRLTKKTDTISHQGISTAMDVLQLVLILQPVSACLYGEDIKKTIQVGALCGWDSDNPTATWGG